MDTEAVVDATTDIVDAVAEHAEVVETVIERNPAVVVGALIGGLVIGAVVSHIVTKTYLSVKYEEIIDRELEEAKNFYAKRLKKFESMQDDDDAVHIQEYVEVIVEETDALDEAVKINSKSGYTSYHTVGKDDDLADITKTLTADDTFDHEAEERKRKKHQPYIVDYQTFYANDDEHHQQSLVYYSEDEVIVDEDDDVVQEWRAVLGHDNLRFGYGSEDSNAVYIRNDRLDSDYEVTLIRGNYHEIVLGE